ncbi:MAG: PLP-dependent aminotransferase family protein [Brachymonas sp.]|nr:PLP-dependent aminotransferase family protein [Brachymonas sp.]
MKDWPLATRTGRSDPTVLHTIFKLTEQPHIISFAGGLPAPESFPVEPFVAAYDKVMRDDPRAALQYAPSEGYAPLRQWIAQSLPWNVSPEQVLVTTGAQQALDLVGKVFIDEGSRVAVQTPTYLGALQAFAAYGPTFYSVPHDPATGDLQIDLLEREQLRHNARFFYLMPSFQNPTGQTMPAQQREQLAKTCHALGLPLIEDNAYVELWFDQPPPPPVSSHYPDSCLYLGSLSKMLAPGLRLGFIVAPTTVYPHLLQAKQAADLNSSSINQRVVCEVLNTPGFLDTHLPRVRQFYKAQCQAMLAALQKYMPDNVTWNTPRGGMFLWVRLPEGLDSGALLPKAIENGVAYVPGASCYSAAPDVRTMRLSFATSTIEQIDTGIAALAQTIKAALVPPATQTSV